MTDTTHTARDVSLSYSQRYYRDRGGYGGRSHAISVVAICVSACASMRKADTVAETSMFRGAAEVTEAVVVETNYAGQSNKLTE